MSERKLPVYLLLDTSGSMRGEPIEAVDNGLKVLISVLRQDPYALESVHICIITFDVEARILTPLTPLEQIQVPQISVPGSGATFLGAALELLISRVDKEVVKTDSGQKGDWRPLAFIMTDGSPSDLQSFRDAIPEIKRRNFANVVVCAAGPKTKVEILKELTDTVVSMDTLDSAGFAGFFKWVSDSVLSGSASAGLSNSVSLPPPPKEVSLVI